VTPGAAAGAPARQRGFALLLVLWTMVLLSLIGSRIAASGRAEAQLAANVRDAAVTEAAADGAVQEAAFHLLDAPPRRWAADGSARRLQMPGAVVEVRVESEDGKVNPNVASAALLAALLHEAGADTRTAGLVADSILRWRFPWVRPGMNDPTLAAYKAAGLNYGPAGAPFRSLDEVGAVLGMTPDLLNRVRPYLSLYATPRRTRSARAGPCLPRCGKRSAGARCRPTAAARRARSGSPPSPPGRTGRASCAMPFCASPTNPTRTRCRSWPGTRLQPHRRGAAQARSGVADQAALPRLRVRPVRAQIILVARAARRLAIEVRAAPGV